MKINDDNGNPIHIGDLAFMILASPNVKGRIVKIEDGGIYTGRILQIGTQKIKERTNGKVTVRCEFEFEFNSQHPTPQVPGLLLLVDPTPDKAQAIKKIYEDAGGKHSDLLELPN